MPHAKQDPENGSVLVKCFGVGQMQCPDFWKALDEIRHNATGLDHADLEVYCLSPTSADLHIVPVKPELKNLLAKFTSTIRERLQKCSPIVGKASHMPLSA